MPTHDLQFWRMAADKNPDPVAFVGDDNKFKYCNTAWCRLVGFSEAELLERSWISITKTSDVGGDYKESEAIHSGDKDEYYLEKTYIHRDGTEIDILLYVHRCPPIGEHKGYVVFARAKYQSRELAILKQQFEAMSQQVSLLEQQAIVHDHLSEKMDSCRVELQREAQENRKLIEALMGRSNVRIGDNVGGDKSGRDKISNDTKIILAAVVALSIVICSVTVIALGGSFQGVWGDKEIKVENNEQ